MTARPDASLLNLFVPLEEFDGRWAAFFGDELHYVEAYLPTAAVVAHPEVVSPRRGRVFGTGHYFFGERLCDYGELVALHPRGGFPGTAHFEEVLLVESYSNYGSDGHVDYRIAGYRFVLSRALQDRRPDGVLRCMVCDTKRYEHLQNSAK